MTRSKKRALLVALILLVLAGGGAGWWYWIAHNEQTTQLPTLPYEEMEPDVAQLVRQAAQQVREAPREGEAWGHLGLVLQMNRFVHQAHPCFVEAEHLDQQNPRWPYYQGMYYRKMNRMPMLCGCPAYP